MHLYYFVCIKTRLGTNAYNSQIYYKSLNYEIMMTQRKRRD